MGLGDAHPKSGSNDKRLDDLVDVVKLPDGKWVCVRVVPSSVFMIRTHWINILASKSKREVRVPRICLGIHPDESPTKVKCPYDNVDSQTSDAYLLLVIDRSAQEDRPRKVTSTATERKTGFLDENSDSWTPIRVLRATPSLMTKIQELKDLNKVTTKRDGKRVSKTFHVDHEKYGIDINIKFRDSAKGTDKYQINTGERTPLTEEELAFLKPKLEESLLDLLGRKTLAEAKRDLASLELVGAEEFEDDGDDDDDLGKKKKSKKSQKAHSEDDADDDDYDDDDDGDDGDDDDDRPSKAKSKKSSRDDDDDDDDDDDGGCKEELD
jgi:hypothetical protein